MIVNILKTMPYFHFQNKTPQPLLKTKKNSLEKRLNQLEKIVDSSPKPILIWVDTNLESQNVFRFLKLKIPYSTIHELTGSMPPITKATLLNDFSENKIDILITKASIAGMGMNFQNACNMVFLGLNYSYESYYQSIRRMYRFGQKNPVNVHIILADNEIGIFEALQKKKIQHEAMKIAMTNAICQEKSQVKQIAINQQDYIIPSFLKNQKTI